MPEWILEVSDLNEYVRAMLNADPALRSVRLRGEISNFKRHSSGHWYFTLKDERCRISAVMFRQNTMRMSLRPMDGMRVIVSGQVSLYPESGTYQVYCENMRPDGVGTLYQQFEALKQKLQLEGLFDAARKRPLPWRPRRIAVVTSQTGAVLHDIRRVSAARDSGVALVLLPVAVQGQGAAEEIAAAIRHAGKLPEVDVIITGRGGGSIEDLWAFNEEVVARAIAESPIPVISAVGHETDTTIADFAADARASTPSNAAEMAVPDRREIIDGLHGVQRHLSDAMSALLQQRRYELLTLQRRMEAVRPEQHITALLARAEALRLRLDNAVDAKLPTQAHRLHLALMRLDAAMDKGLRARQEQLTRARARLTALNPTAVLERGYALVLHGDTVISSAARAGEINQMTLRFRDGSVSVERRNDHGGKEKAHL
ncbi:MAG: exodeoxyribonuclease VII large subunit [Clostridiales bacterium]|nr:exodeoxyribonuclease VII large subunit [Clostridiales bacterium]